MKKNCKRCKGSGRDLKRNHADNICQNCKGYGAISFKIEFEMTDRNHESYPSAWVTMHDNMSQVYGMLNHYSGLAHGVVYQYINNEFFSGWNELIQ